MKSFLLSFIFLLLCHWIQANENEYLIQELDKTLLDYKTYMDAKEMRIANLKSLLNQEFYTSESKYSINNQLFSEYRTYNIDSALHYLNINLEISESTHRTEWLNETKFQLSRVFSTSGMYKESMDVLESIERNVLTETQKPAYYACFEHLYQELAKYTRFHKIAEKYKAIANAYRDSLLIVYPKNSTEYLRIYETKLLEDGNADASRRICLELLAKAKVGTPDYAVAAYRLAMTWQNKDKELYKKYLILSAISDIRAAVKDNTSLALMAEQLYEENDIDRAYGYIKFALEDANFFNARLRLVQVSNTLPLINRAYEIKSERQKAKLRSYLLIISVLTLFLFLAVLFINKQMKRIKAGRIDLEYANEQLNQLNKDLQEVNNQFRLLNLELSEANTIKEQYIGLFLSICSSYIDKMENFRRKAHKLLTNGKTSELIELTKSNQSTENELHEFYENFDNTFLHIYPNFVEELNLLLQDGEKIVLKKGELLNTELRIFALIRLGICDSSRIASLLRYSVNTIYNYRVKIKNKSAVPREEFESIVMKIGIGTIKD